MSSGHHSLVSIEKHHIELGPAAARPIHSASYRAGPKAREYERNEISEMLWEGAIKPFHSKCAAAIVFAPMNDISVLFSVIYRKLNTVMNRDLYPTLGMDICIGSFAQQQVSHYQMRELCTTKWISKIVIETKRQCPSSTALVALIICHLDQGTLRVLSDERSMLRSQQICSSFHWCISF